MGSFQVTLSANTPSTPFPIPGPCNRFQVTIVASASPVYVTCDGSAPLIPTATNDLSSTQRTVPAAMPAGHVYRGFRRAVKIDKFSSEFPEHLILKVPG